MHTDVQKIESILFLLDVLNNKEISKLDALKNAALEKAHIPLLRLSTDGSNEREKIINALSKQKD
jgi:hypothetical protein